MLQAQPMHSWGGLVKKAKKAAASTVKGVANSGLSTSTPATKISNSGPSEEYIRKERMKDSGARETDLAAEAGGLQKYIGLDTPDGDVLWRYLSLTYDVSTSKTYLDMGRRFAVDLTNMLRYMKGNYKVNIPRDQNAFFNRELPSRLKDFTDKILTKGKPMPADDVAAFKREMERIKKLWFAFPDEYKNNRAFPLPQ